MMNITFAPKVQLLTVAALSALITYATISTSEKDSLQTQDPKAMEHKLNALEALLTQREDDLKQLRLLVQQQSNTGNAAVKIAGTAPATRLQVTQTQAEQTTEATPSSWQTLKDLGTNSVNDPRSFPEKVNDLLAADPSKEKIAIVTKGVFDMANDRDTLPDYALQAIYNSQSDPDLKRVIAQVLSQRGNNALLDSQISETQTQLRSDNPSDRQNALTHLAKTHYVNAANAIAPLLQDADINVKLDALLALRATGNQTHIGLAEKLLNDPDPAVSSLASDVISNLRNLSDSARTTLAMADISAELPPIEHP